MTPEQVDVVRSSFEVVAFMSDVNIGRTSGAIENSFL